MVYRRARRRRSALAARAAPPETGRAGVARAHAKRVVAAKLTTGFSGAQTERQWPVRLVHRGRHSSAAKFQRSAVSSQGSAGNRFGALLTGPC
jgi:hypothetical protein